MSQRNNSSSHNVNHCIWTTKQISFASILLDTTISPIIKRLLLLGNLRQQQTTNNNNTEHEVIGLEIERLKQVKQLLVILRSSLDNVLNTVNNEQHNNKQMDRIVQGQNININKAKILHQLNGICVPLFNILQQQQPSLSHKNSIHEHRMHNVIIQSSNYACMEESSLTLASVWKFRQHITEINDGDDGIKSLVLPSLISCAIALSSLEVSKDDVSNTRKDNHTSNEEKKTSEGMNNNAGEHQSLDHGEDCAMAILSCIQSFFSDATDKSEDGDEYDCIISVPHHQVSVLAHGVGSAMGGALVARLVQGCLSLLPQESMNVTSSTAKSHRKENATTLQLKALTTLETLLKGMPIGDLWRSILPGCFAGLYRTALSQLRYSSASSSYKVSAASVQVLALLLKQSLSYEQSTRQSSDEESGNQSIQAITDSLMNAVQLSKHESKRSDVSTTTNNNQIPTELKAEVNKRLVGPLSVLLSLLPTNRSSDVRRSGLHLCQIIMIQTRSVWTESSMKALERKSLEYCLMMLGDDNANVSRSSRNVLHCYKSYLGTSRWKRQLSQTIVPAILDLVEALPAFAKSGREADVKNYLRLIDGYLVISFRGMTDEFDILECLKEKRKSDVGSALSCSEAVNVIKRAFSGKIEDNDAG